MAMARKATPTPKPKIKATPKPTVKAMTYKQYVDTAYQVYQAKYKKK